MTHRVVVHPPPDGFSVGAWMRGDVLAFEHATRGDDSLVSGFEVSDEDVEMDEPRSVCRRGPVRATWTGLERQSLAMRWWFERHPARVPLDRYAAH
jgi:hypothetical protein